METEKKSHQYKRRWELNERKNFYLSSVFSANDDVLCNLKFICSIHDFLKVINSALFSLSAAEVFKGFFLSTLFPLNNNNNDKSRVLKSAHEHFSTFWLISWLSLALLTLINCICIDRSRQDLSEYAYNF